MCDGGPPIMERLGTPDKGADPRAQLAVEPIGRDQSNRMPTRALELLQVSGGEGQGQGREVAAAAAVRLRDQERGRPPRGRLPVAQVRPESRQEQPISEVRIYMCHVCSVYVVLSIHRVRRRQIRVLTTSEGLQ